MSQPSSATATTSAPDLGRARLLAVIEGLRPELYRYCARLVGSVFEGEDVVQDVLVRALAAAGGLDPDTPLRPWLFRIAHNRALDHLRRRAVRRSEPLEAADHIADEALDPAEALARQEAIGTALSRFTHMPIAQRSAVILKDVLGHSLEEIAGLLGLSLDAVKAALSRGRARLKAINAAAPSVPARRPSDDAERFAQLFNRADWDGLRALLADDVHLSQTARSERRGRADVSIFFTIYAQLPSFRFVPAWLDGGLGEEVIAVFDEGDDAAPAWLMQVEWAGGRIARIRDFYYARYIVDGAALVMAKV